jgi:hypothetical protein
LDEVTVIVEALCELELDELPLDEELEVGPPDPPNTLAAADIAPRDDPRLPLTLLRLPRNWGAITAAKRSAAMTPLTRSVRCKSPTPIAAVRTMAPPGPPPPCFGDRRSRFRYKPAPATIATATTPHSNPRGRGLGGTGLTISGRDGARCGSAPPSGLGTEALLISNRMFLSKPEADQCNPRPVKGYNAIIYDDCLGGEVIPTRQEKQNDSNLLKNKDQVCRASAWTRCASACYRG